MKIATRALAGLFAAAVTLSPGAARELPRGQADGVEQSAAKPASRDAQDRRFKWWKDAQVQKELGLITRQSDKVDRIWESTVPPIRAAHDEMEGLQAELSRLIRENTADEKVVALQIDRVEALRSQINKARSLMLYRMHRVLSKTQHDTLTALMDKWRKEREKK
ncbi:MAG: hypothetical protein H0X44_06395 [Acidobacteria bacterium]|nr:hypothetical protein [Acidobacteriota bacterium]